MRFALAIAALLFAVPSHAQSVQLGGYPPFNPIEIAAFAGADAFAIDDAFEQAHGVEVDTPVVVQVPRHPGLLVEQFPAPSSGATIVFQFSQDAARPQDRAYLEDLQITGFNLPMFEDSADPVQARRNYAAGYFQSELFPQWAGNFEQAELFAIEDIALGNATGALQMVAGYYDQANGDNMMVRVVILPHPDRIEGYMAIATINLDLVPVSNPETLAATVTGRVLSSWMYQ